MLNIVFHYWMALTTHPGVPPSDVILTEVRVGTVGTAMENLISLVS